MKENKQQPPEGSRFKSIKIDRSLFSSTLQILEFQLGLSPIDLADPLLDKNSEIIKYYIHDSSEE